MRPTRRLWAVAALAALLAGFAVVLARPLALVGAALIGAWLITRQYLFYRAIARVTTDLSVTQSPAKTGIRTDESVPVTLTASLPQPTDLALTLTAGLPTATTTDKPLAVDLGRHQSADTTISVHWPIAGRHTFDRPTLVASDGLFEETLRIGPAPTVTVEPRGPQTLHVGEGGDRLATTPGEHTAGSHGSGLEPAGLREYVPGDTADRIDWKATARLGTPHVREFDAETDRRTLFVVDHRASLAAGPPTETKLDYLREVVLAMADTAHHLGDPIGLLTVGDGGLTTRVEPAASTAQYTRIRRRLLDVTPTAAPASPETSTQASDGIDGASHLLGGRGRRGAATPPPAASRYAFAALDGDDDAFARTLAPFYADHQPYQTRIESDPLYESVRHVLATQDTPVWTVLCTDDTSPTELRELVDMARSENHAITVLLAPTVLYARDGLTDVEQAYEQYLAFEELRRDLARRERVTALEVGPGDRLAAILAAGERRHDRRSTAAETGGERL